MSCRWAFLALGSALLLASCGPSAEPPATLLLVGGEILTLDPARPRVRSLAVAGETVVALGDEEETVGRRGPGTRVLDLAGRTVVPGFVDHHVHLANLGLSLLNAAEGERLFIDLSGLGEEEIAARVAARAAAVPTGEWILGKGWSQGVWGAGGLPTHHALSAAAPDHPVFLTRVDGHAAWVNRVALAAAGIGGAVPDPPGGAIPRRADGSPAGVLLEGANDLVVPLLPAPAEADLVRAFRLAAEALAALGVVEVFDAGFLPMPGIVALDADLVRFLDALVAADAERPLPLRARLMLVAPTRLAEEALAAPAGWRTPSPRIAVTHLKLFADGALGSRGAATRAPYADDPATTGVPRMTTGEIHEWASRALAAGLDVAVHAIGDAAVGGTLEVFADLLAEQPELDPGRLRIEHFSFASRADMERAARLGVVLSVQPGFVAPGDDGVAMEDARVGAEASTRVYAWESLRRQGARLAFGSDLFTLPGPALATFHAAVTRANARGLPPGGWHPAERLPRDAALRILTTRQAPGGAAVGGVLAEGATADLVVLSANPLAADAADLQTITVEVTIERGRVTHGNAAGPGVAAPPI